VALQESFVEVMLNDRSIALAVRRAKENDVKALVSLMRDFYAESQYVPDAT
jgi:hypothetical protein